MNSLLSTLHSGKAVLDHSTDKHFRTSQNKAKLVGLSSRDTGQIELQIEVWEEKDVTVTLCIAVMNYNSN